MADSLNKLLKKLPGVDRLLEDARIDALMNLYPRVLILDGVRNYLDHMRHTILHVEPPPDIVDYDEIVNGLVAWAHEALKPSLRRAVNGTGIVLHTALGRAPFSEAARSRLADVAASYCTLQIDLATGKRGDRYKHVEDLLIRITGAEAAMVVNNNAAATLLILNTLAGGKEVLVSRGELIEIGGSFRIPDIMKRSGARLVEVGTTNRTHLKDYKNAIADQTALILRVHQSNYRILGFTKQVPIEELVGQCRASNLLFVDDLGSGALVDLSRWGLPREQTVQESVQAGSDVICFSGDKLIGGPQCGIIVGKKKHIDRLKRNQLTRALRSDKMTYAVLEETLRLFLDEDKLTQSHTVLKMLTEPPAAIKKRCQLLARKMRRILGARGKVEVIQDVSEAGSGSLAAEKLPTYALSLWILGASAEDLSAQLRRSSPPILGRIKDNHFLLDGRTLLKEEFQWVEDAVKKIIGWEPEMKASGSKKKTLSHAEKDETSSGDDQNSIQNKTDTEATQADPSSKSVSEIDDVLDAGTEPLDSGIESNELFTPGDDLNV
ncbi:L-seryl-tRNA(Sec) selenium transferase [bacterium I07]|nr:L-seryl-tRNA(Sec) selenium transferase [bacterium I07]